MVNLSSQYPKWLLRYTVVMSMFVLSKWQRVALPTRWRASLRALFYCYLTFLDHRKNISRKVRTKFQNCHLDKTNMDKTNLYRLQISIGDPKKIAPKMTVLERSWWRSSTRAQVLPTTRDSRPGSSSGPSSKSILKPFCSIKLYKFYINAMTKYPLPTGFSWKRYVFFTQNFYQ